MPDVGSLPDWNPARRIDQLYASAHISSPPTQAEMIAILGDPSWLGEGTFAYIDSLDDPLITVWCLSVGGKWFYIEVGDF